MESGGAHGMVSLEDSLRKSQGSGQVLAIREGLERWLRCSKREKEGWKGSERLVGCTQTRPALGRVLGLLWSKPEVGSHGPLSRLRTASVVCWVPSAANSTLHSRCPVSVPA